MLPLPAPESALQTRGDAMSMRRRPFVCLHAGVRNATVRRCLVPVVVVGTLVAGCSRDAGGGERMGGGAGRPDPVPGADWVTESPEDNGMDPSVLNRAHSYAFSEGMNTQGVVVVRHSVIVAEWYAAGSDRDSWAASWSVAKSFTSALIGIAIEEGKISSVDEPMSTYYPEWRGSYRENVTLRDVLQMSSGLDWTEDYDPAAIGSSDIIQMVLYEPDQLAYASDRPLNTEPGVDWKYSSGDTMLLSGVIEQATGMTVDEYANEKLFAPIGMERAEWWRDARGHTLSYCCLDATSRAFARFGLLYLRDGEWGTEQVVESSWVDESLEDAPGSGHVGYGYQWWLADVAGAPDDLFAARGHDGQYIFVIPSLD
jgi:CubicO group peptidase (beta-lactamase class C family)